MLDDWMRELFIRRVLRKLSRQRVGLVLQPGNVWVIEKALETRSEETQAALITCHMRGWVEPITHEVRFGQLQQDGGLREALQDTHVSSLYRLTDVGWSVLERQYFWLLINAGIGLITLVLTIRTAIVG